MKRFFLAICALVFLTSCIKAGSLPPNQVLEKASVAAQTLQSARFNLDATIHGMNDMLPGESDGNISAAGEMQNAGKQLKFTLNADITTKTAKDATSNIHVSSDVVVAGEQEVYLRLNTLTIEPSTTLLPPEIITQMLNQWWMIPSGSGSTADIAPDPSLLRMQTSVIAISKDHGLTDIDGHRSYLYDTTIDAEKMRAYLHAVSRAQGKDLDASMAALSEMKAHGRIWIDAKTFFIHRIVWDIESNDPAKPMTVHLDITITDHNARITIAPPTGAQLFPGLSPLSLQKAAPAASSSSTR